MAAKDRFHEAVKRGLQKEQWTITHDPLRIEFGEYDVIEIDLGANPFSGGIYRKHRSGSTE